MRDRFAALGDGEKHPAAAKPTLSRVSTSNRTSRSGRALAGEDLARPAAAARGMGASAGRRVSVSVEDVEGIVIPALGLDLEIGSGGALTEGALLAIVSGPAGAGHRQGRQAADALRSRQLRRRVLRAAYRRRQAGHHRHRDARCGGRPRRVEQGRPRRGAERKLYGLPAAPAVLTVSRGPSGL